MDAASPTTGGLRRAEDLPGPRGLPLLGNALQIQPHRIHRQLEDWSREFGPCYKLSFGKQTVVVVGNHEWITSMLRDRPNGFRRAPPPGARNRARNGLAAQRVQLRR